MHAFGLLDVDLHVIPALDDGQWYVHASQVLVAWKFNLVGVSDDTVRVRYHEPDQQR